MARNVTARLVDDVHVNRSQNYADTAEFLFRKAFAADGVAADSADARTGITMGDRAALGVIATAARTAGVKLNGEEAVRVAEANGHVFVSAAMAKYGADVAADEAPVPRDTDKIGTFERPRKARPLTERLSLYTPAETARRVRHHDIVDSFHAMIIGDDGEDIPITQPPVIEVSDDANLYVIGYQRSTTWHPITGTSHVTRPRQESMDTESLMDTLERLYLEGHTGVPALRNLGTDPRTLAVLEHTAASGVSYNPSSVSEQDGMIDDWIEFLDSIAVLNEGAFTLPDTLFIGYQAWADTNKSARNSGLDTRSQDALIEELRKRNITAVPTPLIGRRAVLTRTAGQMSALIRIGDRAPRLLHTYTDKAGTHSIVGMRTGGLYAVYGAETCATDLPE